MFRFLDKSKQDLEKEHTLQDNLDQNLTLFKNLYSSDVNKDFVIREFTITANKKRAVLLFYASIVNSTKIQECIIEPLLENEGTEIESIVTVENMAHLNDVDKLVNQINTGSAILLIDGSKEAYSFSVVDFKHRSIGRAQNESIIKGPKESFTESANTNLSLIRKRFHDKDLIAEGVPIGERSKIEVTLMYVNDLVNQEILENVKSRINSLKVDNIRNIELLEQYIEERPYSLIPTMLYTERPDRAAAYLEDGHIVLLMDNSSSCLILPVTFWSFFHSPEDHYLRMMFGNFSRLIRMTAFFITLFISASYVAITTYHTEMVPPDLLLAIAGSRERVPFPVIFEVMIMEFAFELIREAGLRIPSPLGPTIGIVGALILGQAAVNANIISPIIVIIAALSGLSSFAVSDISFNYSLRISRFLFIFAASFYGIYAMAGCFLLWIMYLVSIRSFGVPFLAPLGPHVVSSKDTMFRLIVTKEKWRPSQIFPKDLRKKR